MEHIHHVVGQKGGGERSGTKEQSRARAGLTVYLLFFPALTPCDWRALLNWVLSTHIAALKLPDG